jgi:NDP-sugar pyrophosphorylase family protein
MKAFLLSAGLGTRLLPATATRPKALLPFLNVPLLKRRLRQLASEGVTQAGLNLHHEGRQIVEFVEEHGAEGLALRFFWEPEILGTAGGLKHAESFLEDEDFLVWNVDAELRLDLARLGAAHRESGARLTILVVPNPEPRRFTPLSISEGRLSGIGGMPAEPYLFTGVSVVSPQLLAGIPSGFASLVDALWRPMISRGEPIAAVRHDGDFSDLGSPADFLSASLRALETRHDFEPAEGFFDVANQVLAADPGKPSRGIWRSVLGGVEIGELAEIRESVLWNGARVEAGSAVSRCLVGPVRIERGVRFENSFLWPSVDGREILSFPIHGVHLRSPAVK